MSFESIQIERNKHGYWSHPEYPNWDETVSAKEMHQWFSGYGLMFSVTYFESDASEAQQTRFFEKGDPDVSDWNPTPPNGHAFLLSIHETEEGPVAVWAVRLEQQSPCHEFIGRQFVEKQAS